MMSRISNTEWVGKGDIGEAGQGPREGERGEGWRGGEGKGWWRKGVRQSSREKHRSEQEAWGTRGCLQSWGRGWVEIGEDGRKTLGAGEKGGSGERGGGRGGGRGARGGQRGGGRRGQRGGRRGRGRGPKRGPGRGERRRGARNDRGGGGAKRGGEGARRGDGGLRGVAWEGKEGESGGIKGPVDKGGYWPKACPHPMSHTQTPETRFWGFLTTLGPTAAGGGQWAGLQPVSGPVLIETKAEDRRAGGGRGG